MGGKALRIIVWRLHRFWHRLSWPAVLGLVLLAFEAGFNFFTVAPVVDECAKLRTQLLAQQRRAPQASEPAALNSDPRVDLATFYAALARPSSAPDLLRRLHLSAENEGLLLLQAEYRPLPDPEGKLLRYQILLPAKGTYPEIQRFLAQASRELPGLAIDGVNFKRERIGDTVLDAQIKLTLFLSTSS